MMIPATEKSLGEALVSAKLMTKDELKQAIEKVESRKSPSLIIQLMESQFLKFGVFQKFLSQNYKMRTAILADKTLPQELVEKLGLEFIKEKMVLPIMAKTVAGAAQLALGMVNPLDEKTRAEAEQITKHQVTPVLISLPDYSEAVKQIEELHVRMELTPVASYAEQLQDQKQEEVPSHFEMIQLSQEDSGTQNDTEFLGNQINKFKEEIALKLFFDEKDYGKLKKESYSRKELMGLLATFAESKLQRCFEGLDTHLKFEALANALIAKGLLTKKDLLVSAATSRAFSEEEQK